MIQTLGEEHVRDVARIHCASLSGLLQRVGQPAASAYYRGAIRTGLAVASVYVEDGAVIGFVFGSVHPDKLRRGLPRANPVGVFLGTCIGILRSPSSLVSLVKSYRGPDAGAYDAQVPELTYLATAERCRGSGIGQQLVEAFDRAMQERGVRAYELSVDEDNVAATAFYERLGFRLTGRYREFGTGHCRYRKELMSGPDAASHR